MRKSILAKAAALALVAGCAVGSASAATLTDSFNITLNVGASCSIDQAAGDITMTHDASLGTGGAGNTPMGITCNKDLPYTVEVDSAAGGAVVLTDAATTKTVNGHLLITQIANWNQVPWGSVANGEAFADVGTGSRIDYNIEVDYDNGYQPAVGTYVDTRNLGVNF